MADQSVEVVFDDNELVNFFKGLTSRLSKITKGEKKYAGLLSAIVYRDVNEHFKDEEGPEGPWESWSSSYAKHMQEIGRSGNKILQFSGKLRQNFKPADYRNTENGLLWFNDAQTKSGFPYAALHDDGGPNHPKRSFMWLSNKGSEDISKTTLQFLLDEGI